MAKAASPGLTMVTKQARLIPFDGSICTALQGALLEEEQSHFIESIARVCVAKCLHLSKVFDQLFDLLFCGVHRYPAMQEEVDHKHRLHMVMLAQQSLRCKYSGLPPGLSLGLPASGSSKRLYIIYIDKG